MVTWAQTQRAQLNSGVQCSSELLLGQKVQLFLLPYVTSFPSCFPSIISFLSPHTLLLCHEGLFISLTFSLSSQSFILHCSLSLFQLMSPFFFLALSRSLASLMASPFLPSLCFSLLLPTKYTCWMTVSLHQALFHSPGTWRPYGFSWTNSAQVTLVVLTLCQPHMTITTLSNQAFWSTNLLD